LKKEVAISYEIMVRIHHTTWRRILQFISEFIHGRLKIHLRINQEKQIKTVRVELDPALQQKLILVTECGLQITYAEHRKLNNISFLSGGKLTILFLLTKTTGAWS
jgi:hypothetical protein